MNRVQALRHEDLECTREWLVHLEQRRRQAYEEFLEYDRNFRKELAAMQKKERDFYNLAKTAS